jgi:hypothetical protein
MIEGFLQVNSPVEKIQKMIEPRHNNIYQMIKLSVFKVGMPFLGKSCESLVTVRLIEDIVAHAFTSNTIGLLQVNCNLTIQYAFPKSNHLPAQIRQLIDVGLDFSIKLLLLDNFVDESILKGFVCSYRLSKKKHFPCLLL